MSGLELLRGFFALLFGGILAWGLYRRDDKDFWEERDATLQRRCSPLIESLLLPLYLLALFFLMLFVVDLDYAVQGMKNICLGIFPQIFLYYVVLITVGPMLRRRISARACALLWVLPNFLYFTQHSFMSRIKPRWILHVDGEWVRWAFCLWAVGAVAVLLWKMISHLRYRRYLLQSAYSAEPELLSMWQELQKTAGLRKANYKLMRSPVAVTPVSIGLFRRSIRVVLPETEYSAEELQLILRHELVHILRADSRTKLFLSFCTAIFWFNPLQWIAMGRAAEDLELSCDELVLEDASQEEKHRYAELILRTAGDSRGFTSCLSATASALRYRLSQIMNPGRRWVGGITVGLAFCLLLLTGGHTAIAYDRSSLDEKIGGLSVYEVDSVNCGEHDEYSRTTVKSYDCTAPDELLDYLGSLEVCRLGGSYSFSEESLFVTVWLNGPEGVVILDLQGNCVKWTRLGKETHRAQETYYLPEAPDWDYIGSLLTEQVYEPIPAPADLELDFRTAEDSESICLTSRGKILENTLDGEASERYSGWGETTCVLEGVPAKWAKLNFSFEIPPEELQVTAWDWERTRSRSLTPDEDLRLELEPHSAHYVVEARWAFGTDVGEQVYRMEYRFDVELPESIN